MVNRIVRIGEKVHDGEKNVKKSVLDEAALVNDFRNAISKLDSHQQSYIIRNALRALDCHSEDEQNEKSDRPRLESISLVSHAEDTDIYNGITENGKSETEKHDEIECLKSKVDELKQENEFLTTSLDELDKEHAQSLDAVLLIKDQLVKKHESLQKAYEQLYVECNQAQTKLQLLENAAETNNNSIPKNAPVKEAIKVESDDKNVQTEKINTEEKDVQTRSVTSETVVQTTEIESQEKNCQTEISEEIETTNEVSANLVDLTEKVNEILKNSHIKVEEDESFFECLAKEYVEANWKKEMLERKLTDVTRELNQTAEIKESLQIECYDMQTNIESLLLQIEHLKSNLPSIPEASEERVASLETETESMSEEIKRLQAEHEALKIKNYELITSISILEGSLRNQENLEAEVKNTKQQLDLAKQQLDGASKNVENNANIMQDLSRRLHSSLEENNELRRKIDGLEIASKNLKDENTRNSLAQEEIIVALKDEIENLRKELNESEVTIVKLEKDLHSMNEGKKELEKEIETLYSEKEHLETEISILRENSSEKETGELLQNLRDQLDSANREKSDLEYDLMNMRKELDRYLEERFLMEERIEQLNLEHDKLVKENNELVEQLSCSEKESSERIELLQTEINLSNQECTSLKNEFTSMEKEIVSYKNELSDCKEKYSKLELDLATTRSNLEALGSSNEELKNRAQKLTNLQEELDDLKSFKEKCSLAEDKCSRLEIELRNLRGVEEELKLLRNTCTSLEENSKEMEISKTKLVEMEKRCCELEASLSGSESERVNYQQSNEKKSQIISDLKEKIEKLESAGEKANENAEMAKETIESLSQLIREKDEEIERLKTTVANEAENKNHENAMALLKAERDDIIRLVQEKHNTSLQYYAEIQRLAQVLNEQTTNLQRVIAERDEIAAKLTEKEAEILWSQNELKVVRQRLRSLEESQNSEETCNVVEHSRQISQSTILHEKCNALEAALIQEQSNNRIMQNQLTESQSREANTSKELERLRTHLVEMEASYTEEALISEENRKQLEAKLLQVEEKAQNSSTVYTSASIRANQQVETLQQQMALIVQQRDEIQAKLSAAEDKVLSHTASLTNLQIVLEQFQRDKESDIRAATERLQQQLNTSYKEQEDLRNEIVNLRTQLVEAKECLQAASRLSDQLEKKSERIEELNQEVTKLTELVDTADQRIQEARSSEEGKVDKNLVKNLLLGFLSASTVDKSSVLRVFATVLEFDESEREKIGLNHPTANSGWFSGLLGSTGSPATKDQEASLSAAFVRFLESESKPKPQVPALTISNSSLKRPGHSRQHSSSSTQSGLLLSSITLPSFPDFVPSRNTGSILKEVLKDS
ncbi:thyroid receptor-interacting protein 11-like isoform X2 [Venturia canescens]|nr:thyroid receptor-interacting protein 11-like isoform X2 [Venturia canescens]